MSKMSIKQILVSTGIAFTFIGVLIATILVINTIKPNEGKIASVVVTPATTDNMAGHHAPPAPADNTKFNSLIGQAAPEFSLTSYDGKDVNLAGFKGKNVVLFFSEGAMCYPSCWDQMKAFSKDNYFTKNDVAVLTIVVDDKKTWQDVVNQDSALKDSIVLLDITKEVSKLYGALTVESSMHRGEFPGHSYIVIDKEGVVRNEFDDPDMRINNFEIIESLKKIS